MSAVARADSTEERMRELVSRLLINHKELSTTYRNLHDAAIDVVSGNQAELSYIQKAYLFVSEANLICFYQWELLSITPYIKPDSRSDFFTLRVKDLDRAIFESRDRVNSLKLYYAFIDNERARGLIDEAVGMIEANVYTFEELMALMKPLSNTGNPFDRLRESS
jgi:hypothetical protein